MSGRDNICLTLAVLMTAVWTSNAVYIDYHPNNIPEVREDDRVCVGSSSSLSVSGNSSHWYHRMRQNYMNCTYVDGNLIITWLEDPNTIYDLRFLRDVRYVKGYVLIAMNYPLGDLPLVNLEIIRGNDTFSYGGQDNGLAVLFTNFSRILMPKLKEISQGSVIEALNRPEFRIIVGRPWDDIMKGRVSVGLDSHRIVLQQEEQAVFTQSAYMCHPLCPWRCFMPGVSGCCHSHCAGHCSGPRSTQCELCKDFDVDGDCVSHCPTVNLLNYHPEGSRCVQN